MPRGEDRVVPFARPRQVDLPAHQHRRIQVVAVGDQHEVFGGRLVDRLLGGQEILRPALLRRGDQLAVLGRDKFAQLALRASSSLTNCE